MVQASILENSISIIYHNLVASGGAKVNGYWHPPLSETDLIIKETL